MTIAKQLLNKFESTDYSRLSKVLIGKTGLVQLGKDGNPLFYQEYDKKSGKYSLWITNVEPTSEDDDPDYTNLSFAKLVELISEGLRSIDPKDVKGRIGKELAKSDNPNGLDYIEEILVTPLFNEKLESEDPVEVDFTIELEDKTSKDKVEKLLKDSYNILIINEKMIGVSLKPHQDLGDSRDEISSLLLKNKIEVVEIKE